MYMLIHVQFQVLNLHMYNVETWTDLGEEAWGGVLEQGVGVWVQTLALASLGPH